MDIILLLIYIIIIFFLYKLLVYYTIVLFKLFFFNLFFLFLCTVLLPLVAFLLVVYNYVKWNGGKQSTYSKRRTEPLLARENAHINLYSYSALRKERHMYRDYIFLIVMLLWRRCLCLFFVIVFGNFSIFKI